MSLTFQGNISSLKIQRQLGVSTRNMNAGLQKLSTGYKINSSKDNAASLQISNKLSTQIRGNTQAIQNAQEGASMLGVVEGTMAQFQEQLQRIRELAVQAANDTLGVTQRSAINQEVTQRLAEIDRLGTSTKFNGIEVFNTEDNYTGPGFILYGGGYYQEEPFYTMDPISDPYPELSGQQFKNANIMQDGSGYHISFDNGGAATITYDFTGIDQWSGAYTNTFSTSQQVEGYDSFRFESLQIMATTVNISAAKTIKFQIGSSSEDTIDITSALGKDNVPKIVTSLGTTAASARSFISDVDTALQGLSQHRAVVGTFQNQLQNGIQHMTITNENLASSRSRIIDTDIAKESAKLTQNQILQQFGTSLLSQANQSSFMALDLLNSAVNR